MYAPEVREGNERGARGCPHRTFTLDEFVHVNIRTINPGDSRATCFRMPTWCISHKILCTCESAPYVQEGTSEVLTDACILHFT